MQILVKVPKKNLGTLSEVSKQWQQATRSRDFWKLSCQQKWVAMIASDSMNFDTEKYIIPTSTVNGKTMVDWKFYFYLRKRYNKVSRIAMSHVTKLSERGAALAAKIGWNGELDDEPISKCLGLFAYMSVESHLDCIAVLSFNFVCDFALLRYKRNDLEWYDALINLLDHLQVHTVRSTNHFGFCKSVFELCQFVRIEHPEYVVRLLKIVALLLPVVPLSDSRLERLFSLIVDFMINLGTADLDQKEVGDAMEFQYPSPRLNFQLLTEEFGEHKELAEILINVATRAYQASTDGRIKASALSIGWEPLCCANYDYVQKYYNLATDAIEQKEPKIYFAGLVGLYNLAGAIKTTLFTNEELTKLFQVFTTALGHAQVSLRVPIYSTLLQIVSAIKSELISDTVLDEFITSVLLMLNETTAFTPEEAQSVYKSTAIGTTFKGRLKQRMQDIKSTLFNLAVTGRIVTERVLECYVNLGIQVNGSTEFALEFNQLAKQIVDGTLPFEVSLIKCYECFAGKWFFLTDSENEREMIVNTLLATIPKEVLLFGQSKVPSPVADPKTGPETWADLIKDRNDLVQFELPITRSKSPHVMSKEHIKPVNPAGIISEDDGAAITQDILAAFPRASQLFVILAKSHGTYIHLAQDVLHATLAVLRISHNTDIYWMVLAALALVKEEMEPSDVIKYIDIILAALAKLPYAPVSDDESCQTGILELYYYCLSIMNTMPRLVTVPIVLNAFLGMQDFSVPKLASLSDIVYYFITSWPRHAYEGIRQSSLDNWLYKPIKEAKTLNRLSQYLKVFAIVGGLYGIDYTMCALCTDDPDEDHINMTMAEDYMERIMTQCRDVYNVVKEGKLKMSEQDHKFLRNFLILNSVYLVDHYADIEALAKQDEVNIDRLRDALANENFDTGVPELNEFIRSLDVNGVCRELFLERD